MTYILNRYTYMTSLYMRALTSVFPTPLECTRRPLLVYVRANAHAFTHQPSLEQNKIHHTSYLTPPTSYWGLATLAFNVVDCWYSIPRDTSCGYGVELRVRIYGTHARRWQKYTELDNAQVKKATSYQSRGAYKLPVGAMEKS